MGPPIHPVLICNPLSGGGKVQRFGLVEFASSLGVDTVVLEPGFDLEGTARDAIARGADCLGMAGGDGSQAAVATVAVEFDVPFVCVAAGTRNHFALDLGLDRRDPRQNIRAFRDAVERRIDYGTVNGRLFLNNVSLGVYAELVRQPGYRAAKFRTSATLLPELLSRTAQPFDLQFNAPDGTEVDGAFLVMAANNRYVFEPSLDLAQRPSLDSGELGIFAVAPLPARLRSPGPGQQFDHLDPRFGAPLEFAAPSFEVRSRSANVYAGVDGESVELDPPLAVRIHPGGLRMLVPTGAPPTRLKGRRKARARTGHFAGEAADAGSAVR